MSVSKQYDIILAGGGLSGLTLAVELCRREAFSGKDILIIDRDQKLKNDRTWCFWATDAEYLPPVVFKTWDYCQFFSPGFGKRLDIAPYRYRMVRGVDYYQWAREKITQNPNVEILHASISELDCENGQVMTSEGTFSAPVVFNSALTKVPVLPNARPDYPRPPLSVLSKRSKSGGSTHLLQHFKGWVVKSPKPVFDPEVMTFMDFRIDQLGETRFVYVLPFSETQALVEFTVFSPDLLPKPEYDQALTQYLSERLDIKEFTIEEEEFGVIPMTDFPFPTKREGKTIHIGTAGGFVKPSSGYAFKRTLRKVRNFVDHWEKTGAPDPGVLPSPKVFRVMDSILLRVLKSNNQLGSVVFSSLFKNLPPQLVLRFLDEDSSLLENLRLVNVPPSGPFIKAFVQQLPYLSKI